MPRRVSRDDQRSERDGARVVLCAALVLALSAPSACGRVGFTPLAGLVDSGSPAEVGPGSDRALLDGAIVDPGDAGDLDGAPPADAEAPLDGAAPLDGEAPLDGGTDLDGAAPPDGGAFADVEGIDGEVAEAGPRDAGDGGPPLDSGVPRIIRSTDLTGDGIDDLVVGSILDRGAVRVFAGVRLFRPSHGDRYTSRIVGSTACAIRGPFLLAEAGGGPGTDLIAGLECNGQGRSLMIAEGPISAGELTADAFTRRIALPAQLPPAARLAVGDVTDDGRADLIVGFPDADTSTIADLGAVWIFSDLASLPASPTPHAVITGAAAEKSFGSGLESAPGDLTGDGRPDLLIGAHSVLPIETNGAYVFASPIPAGTRHSAATLAYARITGARGRLLSGVAVAAWDADKNGRLDVALGAHEDQQGGSAAGRVFIFSGPIQRGALTPAMAAHSITGMGRDELGTALHTHGDVNDDGWPDLLAHACCARINNTENVGKLLGVFAATPFRSGIDFSLEGEEQNGRWGSGVSIGDVNMDGFDDFAVGYGTWASNRGAVYVFFGAASITSGSGPIRANVFIPGLTGTSESFGSIVLGR